MVPFLAFSLYSWHNHLGSIEMEAEMANQRDKKRLLREKAEEINEQLTAWAESRDLLRAGEVIVFSMQIEKQTTVREDKKVIVASATEALVVGRRLEQYGFTVVQAARLNMRQIGKIIAPLSEASQKWLSNILITNKNNPTLRNVYTDNARPNEINKSLRDRRFDGKQYRVVVVAARCQLWEVKGKLIKHPVGVPLWDKPVTVADWERLKSAKLTDKMKVLLERLEKADKNGLPTSYDFEDSRLNIYGSEVRRFNAWLRKGKIPLSIRDIKHRGRAAWAQAYLGVVHIEYK